MMLKMTIHKTNERLEGYVGNIKGAKERINKVLTQHGINEEIIEDCLEWCNEGDFEDSYETEEFGVYLYEEQPYVGEYDEKI